MKLWPLPLVAVLAMALPSLLPADTVYFKRPGTIGIESVSGTILRDSGSVVEIATGNGETVTIRRADVFQIVRDAKIPAESPAAGAETAPEAPDAADGEPAPAPESTDPAPVLPGEYADFGKVASRLSADSGRSASGARRAYQVGLQGGMNVANLSVDPAELEDDSSLKSYAVGAWWGFPLNRRLAIRTEAVYSVKGDAETDGGTTASTKMGYIDVPVLARIGFLHGGPIQPSLFVGPSLALNLFAKSRLETDGGDVEVDVKDQVRAFDLGLVVGGGVDFPLGGRTYGLDLRYSKGLSNAVGEDANGTAHNDVFAVMGSVGFQ